MKVRLLGVALGLVIALFGAGAAWAHQTTTNNGVTVTLHVAPGDEPVATRPATVVVESVKTRTGRFSWATCLCTLEISNASREVLRRGRAERRLTFTFPEAGAYRITVAGRVKRKAGWRPFKVSAARTTYILRVPNERATQATFSVTMTVPEAVQRAISVKQMPD